MALKLYSDYAPHRARQLVADIGFALWSVLWIWIATRLYALFMPLAAPGRQLENAGEALAGNFDDAGQWLSELPFIGEGAASPFDRLSDAGDSLAAAGAEQQQVVSQVALFLSITLAVLAISMMAVVWLPLRVRFIRRASAAQQYVDDAADLDLFALRAMSRQPLDRLTQIDPDPVGAWRRGDQRVINALAGLELRDEGLRMPGVTDQLPPAARE